MDANLEDLKGKAKEKLGNLTGDDSLKNEGKGDQIAANVKDKLDGVKDWIADKVDEVHDKTRH